LRDFGLSNMKATQGNGGGVAVFMRGILLTSDMQIFQLMPLLKRAAPFDDPDWFHLYRYIPDR